MVYQGPISIEFPYTLHTRTSLSFILACLSFSKELHPEAEYPVVIRDFLDVFLDNLSGLPPL